jgi:hypothetical protein
MLLPLARHCKTDRLPTTTITVLQARVCDDDDANVDDEDDEDETALGDGYDGKL